MTRPIRTGPALEDVLRQDLRTFMLTVAASGWTQLANALLAGGAGVDGGPW